jgi:hypothetical protein
MRSTMTSNLRRSLLLHRSAHRGGEHLRGLNGDLSRQRLGVRECSTNVPAIALVSIVVQPLL